MIFLSDFEDFSNRLTQVWMHNSVNNRMTYVVSQVEGADE